MSFVCGGSLIVHTAAVAAAAVAIAIAMFWVRCAPSAPHLDFKIDVNKPVAGFLIINSLLDGNGIQQKWVYNSYSSINFKSMARFLSHSPHLYIYILCIRVYFFSFYLFIYSIFTCPLSTITISRSPHLAKYICWLILFSSSTISILLCSFDDVCWIYWYAI